VNIELGARGTFQYVLPGESSSVTVPGEDSSRTDNVAVVQIMVT
jgi:archaellum component FlaF (FlaF/FlaG flagellin family)